MKTCIVAQNTEWLTTAGARIRYGRLVRALAALGHELEMPMMDDLTARDKMDAEVYVFSKVHDARALLLMRTLRAQGRLIGVDFVDDYYS